VFLKNQLGQHIDNSRCKIIPYMSCHKTEVTIINGVQLVSKSHCRQPNAYLLTSMKDDAVWNLQLMDVVAVENNGHTSDYHTTCAEH